MQDDRGIKQILTLSWAYNLFQNLVGATNSRRWVAEHFWRAQPGQKVVDLGCGPATTVHFLPAGVKYVGFDVSDKYISSAKAKYASDPDKIFLAGIAEQECGMIGDGELCALPFGIAGAGACGHEIVETAAQFRHRRVDGKQVFGGDGA